MNILIFELAGEMAMWRNVYEPMGSYSCLGPAPSNLAGLIGAAVGFAAPCSVAADHPDEKKLEQWNKAGLVWPVAPELLQWEESKDFQVACRWIGKKFRRISWNVNGYKYMNEKGGEEGNNLRLQQQVILDPAYEVAAALPAEEAERVAAALLKPAFPLCLGASFCRAIVRNVRIEDAVPESPFWAFRTDGGALGEATPFSRHIVNPDSCFERIRSDGYWIYPTPDQPGVIAAEPLVRGWVRAGE